MDEGESKLGGVSQTAVFSIVLYSAFSSSMLVVNKVTMAYLPFPSLISFVQICSSVLLVNGAERLHILRGVDAFAWAKVKPYLFYVALFALALLTNMKSLQAANVETVIVFRSLTPVAVAALDAMFLGRELPCARSCVALAVIALGALGYARCDEAFGAAGLEAYRWPAAYFVVIAIEMTYGKLIVHGVDMDSKIWGPVLYTNALAAPVMLGLLAASDDVAEFRALYASEGGVPAIGYALLGVGCLTGTGISYAGWLCRSKTSASTYTVVGVLNKCGTILANLMIWTNHASPEGIASLFVCLLGGTIYKQAPIRDAALPRLAIARVGDASKRCFASHARLDAALPPDGLLAYSDSEPDLEK